MKNVRLYYNKTGRMKFVSHLDMNRYMSRLIKLSKLPVWYTEGFNQHIYINFALPLSLGFESKYEVMDIRLLDDEITLEEIVDRLNTHTVEGIEFWDATDPQKKFGKITSADYEIEYLMDDNTLKCFEEFLNSTEIPVEKKTKKGDIKTIDIAKMINSHKVIKTDNTVKAHFNLSAGGSENLNPSLITDAFTQSTGKNVEAVSVVRTCLYDETGVPFR